MARGLVVLMGLPGSGKTTLARWLSQNSKLVVVSRDSIRAAMFPRCAYTLEEKLAAYAAMKQAIEISLSQGLTVCTDGMTFANRSDRADTEAIARAAGANYLLVHCECPIEVAQQRVAEDTETFFPDRDAAAVIEVSERLLPAPPEAWTLDMTEATSQVGMRLLDHLSTLGWDA